MGRFASQGLAFSASDPIIATSAHAAKRLDFRALNYLVDGTCTTQDIANSETITKTSTKYYVRQVHSLIVPSAPALTHQASRGCQSSATTPSCCTTLWPLSTLSGTMVALSISSVMTLP